MPAEFLYQQSELLIAVVLLGLLALMSELGYRLGRWAYQPHGESTRAQVVSIQAAILGLFSLLLGFTFAMALSRFDYRKQMVVEESNAIATAALRAQFVPTPHGVDMSDLFRHYVDTRLHSVLRTTQSSPARQQIDIEIGQVQRQLWDIASEASKADPQSVPAGLYAQAVNELMDIKAKRDSGVANHVPETVLWLLMVFAVLAVGILAYGNGLAGARNLIPTATYSIIVVLVVLLIIDLDHPQSGLARVSQASMIQLQEALKPR